eukprot:Pgem_evm1s7739
MTMPSSFALCSVLASPHLLYAFIWSYPGAFCQIINRINVHSKTRLDYVDFFATLASALKLVQ